eukprot:TRINITY_DN6135_c0_g1_i1.p1 TRINITY_DN6135_c0_g1~~TRINITY_DN6135_c0_g1_i1.p1  ORF type:complete len:199 (+),score=53.87 TRINITY_DN6135_c0_g1_i1:99-695(+)
MKSSAMLKIPKQKHNSGWDAVDGIRRSPTSCKCRVCLLRKEAGMKPCHVFKSAASPVKKIVLISATGAAKASADGDEFDEPSYPPKRARLDQLSSSSLASERIMLSSYPSALKINVISDTDSSPIEQSSPRVTKISLIDAVSTSSSTPLGASESSPRIVKFKLGNSPVPLESSADAASQLSEQMKAISPKIMQIKISL